MASELTRLQGSEDLVANIGYLNMVGVRNDFDQKKPWSDIQVITDTNGEKWIRIPKFYTKYVVDANGIIRDRYVSIYHVDDNYFLNPVFKTSDGTELEYIEVAAYLLSMDNGVARSKSGVSAVKGQSVTVGGIRTAVNARDNDTYNYQLFDIWTYQLLCDLFTVEYATTNAGVLHGYESYRTESSATAMNNGCTDELTYPTGVATNDSTGNNGTHPMRYRYIENLWGMGNTFIDGILFFSNMIYINQNPDTYMNAPASDTNWKTSSIARITTTGSISQLSFDSTYSFAFPSAVKSSDGAYIEKLMGATDDNFRLFMGNSDTCGMWSQSQGTNNPYVVYRMVRKPKV